MSADQITRLKNICLPFVIDAATLKSIFQVFSDYGPTKVIIGYSDSSTVEFESAEKLKGLANLNSRKIKSITFSTESDQDEKEARLQLHSRTDDFFRNVYLTISGPQVSVDPCFKKVDSILQSIKANYFRVYQWPVVLLTCFLWIVTLYCLRIELVESFHGESRIYFDLGSMLSVTLVPFLLLMIRAYLFPVAVFYVQDEIKNDAFLSKLRWASAKIIYSAIFVPIAITLATHFFFPKSNDHLSLDGRDFADYFGKVFSAGLTKKDRQDVMQADHGKRFKWFGDIKDVEEFSGQWCVELCYDKSNLDHSAKAKCFVQNSSDLNQLRSGDRIEVDGLLDAYSLFNSWSPVLTKCRIRRISEDERQKWELSLAKARNNSTTTRISAERDNTSFQEVENRLIELKRHHGDHLTDLQVEKFGKPFCRKRFEWTGNVLSVRRDGFEKKTYVQICNHLFDEPGRWLKITCHFPDDLAELSDLSVNQRITVDGVLTEFGIMEYCSLVKVFPFNNEPAKTEKK